MPMWGFQVVSPRKWTEVHDRRAHPAGNPHGRRRLGCVFSQFHFNFHASQPVRNPAKRARFYDANLGRFHTLDEYEGRTGEPLSLHKYLYAHGNPVSGWDPSGRMSLIEMATVNALMSTLSGLQGTVGFLFIDSLTSGPDDAVKNLLFSSALTLGFPVLGRVASAPFNLTKRTLGYINKVVPGGMARLRGLRLYSGLWVFPHSVMKRAINAWGFSGFVQSNHLAPVGLFGKIPKGKSLAIPLAGSINDIGSAHWRYHATIDNAIIYGHAYDQIPTVGKFIDEILPDALMNAGIDPATANSLSDLSETQILGYYNRSDELPRVPSHVKFPI